MVGPNPSITSFWQSNNCDGEAHELWIEFRLNPNKGTSELDRLLEGKRLAVNDGIVFVRNSSDKPLVLLGICFSTSQDMMEHGSEWQHPKIDVVSLLREIKFSSGPVDSFQLPIWLQSDAIYHRIIPFISSHLTVKQHAAHAGTIFCYHTILDSGFEKCLGHLITNEGGKRGYGHFGVHILVDLANPSWEVIKLSAVVLRHSFEIHTSRNQTEVEKKDLLNCSGGLAIGENDLTVSRDNHTVWRKNDHTYTSVATEGQPNKEKDRDCEVSLYF